MNIDDVFWGSLFFALFFVFISAGFILFFNDNFLLDFAVKLMFVVVGLSFLRLIINSLKTKYSGRAET